MIDNILTSSRFINEEVKFLTILSLNYNYFLKIHLTLPSDHEEKYVSCELEIKNLTPDDVKILFECKFFNKCIERFKCENILPLNDDLCLCEIIIKFPPELGGLVFIDIFEVYIFIIDNLNISQSRKDELHKIIDDFLREDFENAINNICIFGEFIAKELARKISKKDKDFKTAINTIVNYNMTEKTKINYNYLGSVLYPLYYIRNQKLHPYSKINFDESITELLFTNLSMIIDFLNDNRIKL